MTPRYENLSIKKIKIIVNCWNTDTWIQAGSEAGRKTEMMGGLCELKNLNYILNPRGSFKKKTTLLSIITNVISSLKDELRGGKLAKRLLEQLRWEMRIWTKKEGLETEMEQIQETEHYQEVFMMEWMWEMRRFIPSHLWSGILSHEIEKGKKRIRFENSVKELTLEKVKFKMPTRNRIQNKYRSLNPFNG